MKSKQKNTENFLGTDAPFNVVLKLAIPSMLAQFVNVLYSIVDRIYIGHMPDVGTLALAGAVVNVFTSDAVLKADSVKSVAYTHLTLPTKSLV